VKTVSPFGRLEPIEARDSSPKSRPSLAIRAKHFEHHGYDGLWPSSDAQVSHLNDHCGRIANLQRADATVSSAVSAAI
jgi:hypothetical protein